MPADDDRFTGPQSYIRSLQDRFAGIYQGKEENLEKALSAYKDGDGGPRFMIPMYCHRGPPQPMENILRFRYWGKDLKGEATCCEFTTLKEAQDDQREQHKADGGKRRLRFIESEIIGVVWDNASGCFVECQVKELVEKEKKPK